MVFNGGGEKGGRGYGGGEGRGKNIYLSLHCHHLSDSALRWAVMTAILMFH